MYALTAIELIVNTDSLRLLHLKEKLTHSLFQSISCEDVLYFCRMLLIEMFEHPDMVFFNVHTIYIYIYIFINCPSSGEMDNAYKKNKKKKLKISKDSVDNNTNTPTDTK